MATIFFSNIVLTYPYKSAYIYMIMTVFYVTGIIDLEISSCHKHVGINRHIAEKK
jgi:hypothetical protein